jgi:hypothetical protein
MVWPGFKEVRKDLKGVNRWTGVVELMHVVSIYYVPIASNLASWLKLPSSFKYVLTNDRSRT